MQPNTNHLGVGDLLFEVFTRLNPSVSWKLEPKNQSCSRYVFVKDVESYADKINASPRADVLQAAECEGDVLHVLEVPDLVSPEAGG